MAEFFRQYTFKDTGERITSWDQFNSIRLGAVIVKSTGEEYEKADTNVFTKCRRTFLDGAAVDNKNFAVVNADNKFSVVQSQEGEPTEDNHLVTKKYVDETLVSAKVNLNGFARTDVTNEFEKIQNCNVYPTRRAHLVNKAYVDDKIDDLSFDTSSFAKLHVSNTFTVNQSIVVDPVAPNDIATKKYVDNLIDQQNVNLDNYVRSDLPNVFDAPQTYNDVIYVGLPKTAREAVNKGYVDDLVAKIETASQHFARTDTENTFTLDQTFNGYIISNSEPQDDEHVVNKGFLDKKIFDLNNNIKEKYYASTTSENVFLEAQTFSKPITVPDTLDDTNIHFAVNKEYVDRAIREYEIPYPHAGYEGVFGLVSLSDDIDNSRPPENVGTVEEPFYNATVPTSYAVREYIRLRMGDSVNSNTANEFGAVQYFFNGIVIGNKDHDMPDSDKTAMTMDSVPFFIEHEKIQHPDYYAKITDGFVGGGFSCITTEVKPASQVKNAGEFRTGFFNAASSQTTNPDGSYSLKTTYIVGSQVGRVSAYRYVGLTFDTTELYDVNGIIQDASSGDPILINQFYVPLNATGDELVTAKWLSSDSRYCHLCPDVKLGNDFPKVDPPKVKSSVKAYDLLHLNKPSLQQLINLSNQYSMDDTVVCNTEENTISLVSTNGFDRKSGFIRFVPTNHVTIDAVNLKDVNIIIGNVDIVLHSATITLLNSNVIFEKGVNIVRIEEHDMTSGNLFDLYNSSVRFAYDTKASGTCAAIVYAANGSVVDTLPDQFTETVTAETDVIVESGSFYKGYSKDIRVSIDATSYAYDKKDFGKVIHATPYNVGTTVDHSTDYYKQSLKTIGAVDDYDIHEASSTQMITLDKGIPLSIRHGMSGGVEGTHIVMYDASDAPVTKSFGVKLAKAPAFSEPALVNQFYVPLNATGDELVTAKWLGADSRYRRLCPDVKLGAGLSEGVTAPVAKTDSGWFYRTIHDETPTLAEYVDLSNEYGMYNTTTIKGFAAPEPDLSSSGAKLLSGFVNVVPTDKTTLGECVIEDQHILFSNVVFSKGLKATDCTIVFDGPVEFNASVDHVGMQFEHCDVKFRKGCSLKFSGPFDTYIIADKHSDIHGISSMTVPMNISNAPLSHAVGAVVHNYSIIDDSNLPFDIELDAFSMAYKKAYDVEFTVNNASFKTATIRHGTKWKDVKDEIPTPVDGDREFLGWEVTEDNS